MFAEGSSTNDLTAVASRQESKRPPSLATVFRLHSSEAHCASLTISPLDKRDFCSVCLAVSCGRVRGLVHGCEHARDEIWLRVEQPIAVQENVIFGGER